MEVALAVLADSANISQEGNLNILGIFNGINAQRFPVRHPKAVLVLTILARPSERGQPLRITIKLMDEDKVLSELQGEGSVPEPEEGHFEVRLNMLFNLVGMEFPHPGDYAFHVLINGSEQKVVSFRVRQVSSPGTA